MQERGENRTTQSGAITAGADRTSLRFLKAPSVHAIGIAEQIRVGD